MADTFCSDRWSPITGESIYLFKHQSMALFDKVLHFLPGLLLLFLTYPYLNTSPSCHLPRKIRVMKTPSLLSNSKTPSEPTDISRFPCGTCDLTVDSDDDLGVACDGCGLWYHLACQNIPSGEYDQLGDSNVIWHCSICEFVNRSIRIYYWLETNTI